MSNGLVYELPGDVHAFGLWTAHWPENGWVPEDALVRACNAEKPLSGGRRRDPEAIRPDARCQKHGCKEKWDAWVTRQVSHQG